MFQQCIKCYTSASSALHMQRFARILWGLGALARILWYLHKKQFINQTKNKKTCSTSVLTPKICICWWACVSMAFEENIALLKCFQQKIRAFCAMLRLQILRYFLRPSLKVGLKVSATQNDAQCTFLIMNAFYTIIKDIYISWHGNKGMHMATEDVKVHSSFYLIWFHDFL